MAVKKKAAPKRRVKAAPKKPFGLSESKYEMILGDIAAGDAAYKAALAHDVTMGTFWREMSKTPTRVEKYARAKAAGLERLAEEIVQIADESRIGEKRKTTVLRDGYGESAIELPAEEITTGDMVERSRLQIDSRKWLLAKLMPKKYGDKVQVGGADDLPPVGVNHTGTVALDFDAIRAKRGTVGKAA